MTPPITTTSRRGFLGLAGRAGTIGAAMAASTIAGPIASASAETDDDDTTPTVSGGPIELGYAETVREVTTTSSVTIPNLALRVALGDSPISVEYGTYVSSSVANGFVKLYLLRDGVPIHEVGCSVSGAPGVAHLRGQCRIPPTQTGTVNLTVLLASWSAKATARAIAMPMSPAFLQARRL